MIEVYYFARQTLAKCHDTRIIINYNRSSTKRGPTWTKRDYNLEFLCPILIISNKTALKYDAHNHRACSIILKIYYRTLA